MDRGLAGQPTKVTTFGMEEATKRRAMNLSAHRAVAVIDELGWAIEFEANLPAQT
jgi:hypothetical protein